MTVAGINFYLSPYSVQPIRADGIVTVLLDNWCKGVRPSSTYDELCGQFGRRAVNEAVRELEILAEAGMLFEQRLSGRQTSKASVNHAGQERAQRKYLSLQMHANCNLRCVYCYQKLRGRLGPMSWGVAAQSIEMLDRSSLSGDVWEITFYGGEPLLNSQLIFRVVAYASALAQLRGCKLSFRIITNGTLLSEGITRNLAKYDFSVELSLDGQAGSHDRYRKTAGGGSTHRTILRKIPLLMRQLADDRLLVKMVVTHETIDELEDNLSYLWSLGLRRIAVLPVVAPYDTSLELTTEDVRKLAAIYERLVLSDPRCMGEITSHPAFGTFYEYWHRVDGKEIKHYRCPAGTDGDYFVNTEGEIYPCAWFSGLGYRLGNVKKGVDRVKSEMWLDARARVDDNPACADCWARYYCGGPCYGLALETTGNPVATNEEECLVRKTLIESALRTRLQVGLARAGRQRVDHVRNR